MAAQSKLMAVAVGVLCRSDGEVLFAQRPKGKPMAGYWEFPGGKLELGESVHEALARELFEELGIHIGSSTHWQTIEHVYPHAHVALYFHMIHDWVGDPHAKEGQLLSWQRLVVGENQMVALEIKPILPATEPLLLSLAKTF